MKKYQYLASWDDQTLTRVGEPVVVLGDSNISQVEVTMPSNFLLDPTGAVARMYFLLPGEKGSDFETLETATRDENGDYHVTWTIKHAHTQKGGRLAFSLTLIGDNAQWDSRTVVIPVYESRYQPESEEAEEPYEGRLTALEGTMASIRGEFAEVQEAADEATETASAASAKVDSAITKADAVDERLDNIIIESGTSEAEVVAARTNSDTGTTYNTLGARLDAEYSEIKEDLSVIGYVAPASSRYTGNNLLPNPATVSRTSAGVTYTWDADTSTWTVSGTASGTSLDNLYNGITNLSMPDGIEAGGTYYVEFEPSDSNINVEFLWYDASKTLTGTFYTPKNTYITVPENTVGCVIRLRVYNTYTANGTTSNPRIYLAVDNTNDIISMLNSNSICTLGKGDYYVNNLIMPNNSTLSGVGEDTVIKYMYKYNTAGYAISPTSGCKVNDITIIGAITSPDITASKGRNNGIQITGTVSSAIRLCNITIHDCNRFGIYAEETGSTTRGGVIIVNAKIDNCWAGIYFSAGSEYNKVSNCIIRACNRACVNNGGNNVFANTTFHGIVGFLIEGGSTNSGHGTCVGCTFNHINNIANPDTLGGGRAVFIGSLTNGFVFDACQFWYGAIYLSNSRGVTVCNSQMGDGAQNPHITVTGSHPAFFNNIIFHQTPVISDACNSKFTACYLDSDGSTVTG